MDYFGACVESLWNLSITFERLDKVGFACVLVFLIVFVCFLSICRVFFEFILCDHSSVLHPRFSCYVCIVFLSFYVVV